MIDSIAWGLLLILAFIADMVWVFAALTRRLTNDIKIVNWIFFELRPFFLPSVVVEIIDIAAHRTPDVWDCFFIASSIYIWFRYKGEDDGRWKKRRAKVLEKITRRGAKLVVVPE